MATPKTVGPAEEVAEEVKPEGVTPDNEVVEKTLVDSWYPSFLDKEADGDDETKAANWVDERRKSMAAARQAYEEIWRKNEDAYLVKQGATIVGEEWRSTMSVPLTHGMVETAVAEYADSQPKSFIDAGQEAYDEGAKIIKDIEKYTLMKGDADLEDNIAYRSMGIYGTAIAWEYYREDPVILKELKSVAEDGVKTWDIYETTEFNDPYRKVISPWDFYPHEAATTAGNMIDCIRRETFELHVFKDIYKRYKKAADVTAGGETEQKEANPRPEGASGKEMVEVLHYYNKPQDIYWIVANGVLLNEFESALPDEHKMLPFAEGCYIKRLNHFWGLSIPEIIAGTQSELNTLRRLRMDRAKLNIAKVFLISERADIDDDELLVKPGLRINVQDPNNSVKTLDFSDTGMSAYKEEEALLEDSRLGSGISNPSMASTTGATATESAIVKESTLKRIRAGMNIFRITYTNRLGRLRLANILSWYRDPVRVNQVTGKDGEIKSNAIYRQIQVEDPKTGALSSITISPDDIRGEYHFRTQSMSSIPLSKALEEQRSEMLFDRLIQLPTTDPVKATKWLMDKHNEDPYAVLMDNIDTAGPELAEEENARMMQGAQLPGTIGATPEHTAKHLAFVEANAWTITPNIDRLFTDHINAELNPTMPKGVGQLAAPVNGNGSPMSIGGPAGAAPMPGQATGPEGGAPLPAAAGVPGQPQGGSPLSPDMSFDQQQMGVNQSIA
jgi:hypothetical protein